MRWIYFVSILISTSSLGLAQGTSPCGGCEDTSPFPTAPPAESYTEFGNLLGTVTWTVTLTRSDGACRQKVQVGGGNSCVQKTPCTPKVVIEATVDGDFIIQTEQWDVTALGTVGYSDQNSFSASHSGGSSKTLTLFDSNVSVSCGANPPLTSNVTYTVALSSWAPLTGAYVVHNFIGSFFWTFNCSECSL